MAELGSDIFFCCISRVRVESEEIAFTPLSFFAEVNIFLARQKDNVQPSYVFCAYSNTAIN